jgi:pimeloyl-ACP methyl ester carboxylesterase
MAQSQSDRSAQLTKEQSEKALKDIYFISGLGADKRVFQRLEFKGYRPVHIDWLEPQPGESLTDYAQRLITQIKSEHPIIIGLSFGGIVAVEIAKQIQVDRVILISSTKDKSEIPFYFKLFRWLPFHRIFPYKSFLFIGYWLIRWFFGLESQDECQLLKAILFDTDANFIKWAIHQVVIWNNETIPDNLYHIHGLRDRIFPIRFVEPDFVIEKAGHFMVSNRAFQISKLLEKIIN